jgi:hypothetical protein
MMPSGQQGQTWDGQGASLSIPLDGGSVSQQVNSEASVELKRLSSHLVSFGRFGKTRFGTQELEEVGSQAVAILAKGDFLNAVVEGHCQDQWISENILDTYNDMIQRVMNEITT